MLKRTPCAKSGHAKPEVSQSRLRDAFETLERTGIDPRTAAHEFPEFFEMVCGDMLSVFGIDECRLMVQHRVARLKRGPQGASDASDQVFMIQLASEPQDV